MVMYKLTFPCGLAMLTDTDDLTIAGEETSPKGVLMWIKEHGCPLHKHKCKAPR